MAKEFKYIVKFLCLHEMANLVYLYANTTINGEKNRFIMHIRYICVRQIEIFCLILKYIYHAV